MIPSSAHFEQIAKLHIEINHVVMSEWCPHYNGDFLCLAWLGVFGDNRCRPQCWRSSERI